MTDFLDDLRAEQKKQRVTPQQVYKVMNQSDLSAALRHIKNIIRNDALNNPTSKNLKGRCQMWGARSAARIDQTADIKTDEYIINRNYLASDNYSDFATGYNYTWMITAPLYEVKENIGFMSNTSRIVLTKRGKIFLNDLKKLCEQNKISVKFCAHAEWNAANKLHSGEVYVDFDKEFKAKGKLVNTYIVVEYSVKL